MTSISIYINKRLAHNHNLKPTGCETHSITQAPQDPPLATSLAEPQYWMRKNRTELHAEQNKVNFP